MQILFEDKQIVVCKKDRGVLSQQDMKGGKNMVDLLSRQCECEIYPVHRLDKEVGGVMVYAKTKKAAAHLSEQVASRGMEKMYFAVTHGKADTESGTMEDLLYFDKGKNKSFVVKKERRGVKKAVLEYEQIKSLSDKNLFKIRLLTGRTHQIRVQFASRRMPLYGDRRYGARDETKIIALWSYSISFDHPTSGERMSFELLPDEDEAFRDIL